MSTDTTTADQTAADEATAAKEQEKVAKAEQAAAAKAEKARIAAEKKAKREQERIEKTASEGGIDLADVTGTGDDGAVTLNDVKDAVKAARAVERANREKKAPMTLSQRRAILKLGNGPVVAKTDFNCLPLDYLVSVGLAQKETVEIDETYTVKEPEEYFEGEGDARVKKTRKVDVEKTRKIERPEYSLTDKGQERVGEINGKWLTWKPDSATSATPAPEPTDDAPVAA